MTDSFYEDLSRSGDAGGGSDRSFGFVWAAFLALLGVTKWHGIYRAGALAAAAALTLLACFHPSLLSGPNRLWTRFGILLGRIMTPVITGTMFCLLFVPMGLLLRICGVDSLRLRRHGDSASTYWIPRQPPGPEPASMSKQF